jgi:hypothetical protein
MKKTGDETVKRELAEEEYIGRECKLLEENSDNDNEVVFVRQRA